MRKIERTQINQESKIKSSPQGWQDSSFEGRYQLKISKPAGLLNNFNFKMPD